MEFSFARLDDLFLFLLLIAFIDFGDFLDMLFGSSWWLLNTKLI